MKQKEYQAAVIILMIAIIQTILICTVLLVTFFSKIHFIMKMILIIIIGFMGISKGNQLLDMFEELKK